MRTTLEEIWAKAQRLSPSERRNLSQMLLDSIEETEESRQERVAKEMDRFFGGWCVDERSTEQIMQDIRSARTENSFS